MRWITGWSGTSGAAGPELAAIRPLAGTPLWSGPDPLWAVGDWRPEEIRLAVLRPGAPAAVTTGLTPPEPADRDTPATVRLAVLGRCGASDAELAAGLAAARGGAVRHLTRWPGSYTVVLRTGTRSTVLLADLAGALPVFHTPWCGGTAYATTALALADLVGAPLDPEHLAARLAVPESPEALGTGTPYAGVHRVPPGHALGIRGGRPYTDRYEEPAGPGPRAEAPAVRELTRALLEAVRCRVRSSAPVADRPRLGVDLSYGTASATVALLAAAVPIGPAPTGRNPADPPVPRLPPPPRPGPYPGGGPGPARPPVTVHPDRDPVPENDPGVRERDPDPYADPPRTGAVKGSWARGPAPEPPEPLDPEALAAVTVGRADGLALAVDVPRLRHIVLPPAHPYAGLAADPLTGPLTDEPGPALIAAERLRAAYRAGGADHLTGHGARQVLDGHPARLADLIRTGRSRELLAPVAALAGADRAVAGALTGTLRTPLTVLRAAHRLARARYAEGLDDLALKLTIRKAPGGGTTAGASSAADLAWGVPGPAARWLTDDALATVAQRLRTAARGPAPTEHPGARRAGHALHRHAAGYRTLVHAAEQYGQRLHAPFLDNQVVRAARLLPDDVRLQPGARHALLRAVLTGAGRNDLPPDWGRTPRPDRAEADRTGLRLAADSLHLLFERPLLGEIGLLDTTAVRRTLARAADPDTPLPSDTLDGLAELIATELWLRRLTARRAGSSWTGLPPTPRPALTRT
ncbi:asparagine synthase-related protein [Kitasatospora camelliae]|uniref:Asparagine synthase-related protein n=1 Tax=Kitasatospora camelliae TaxID=3156397 RepID=A0AAU8JWV4_9ACTN